MISQASAAAPLPNYYAGVFGEGAYFFFGLYAVVNGIGFINLVTAVFVESLRTVTDPTSKARAAMMDRHHLEIHLLSHDLFHLLDSEKNHVVTQKEAMSTFTLM